MIAYQLIVGRSSYEEGWVESVVKTYTNRKAAEEALRWYKDLPRDPYAPYNIEVSINEIDIEEVFTPWVSEEQISRMKAEEEQYNSYVEAEMKQAAYEEEMDAYYAQCCSE